MSSPWALGLNVFKTRGSGLALGLDYSIFNLLSSYGPGPVPRFRSGPAGLRTKDIDLDLGYMYI